MLNHMRIVALHRTKNPASAMTRSRITVFMIYVNFRILAKSNGQVLRKEFYHQYISGMVSLLLMNRKHFSNMLYNG